MAGLDIKTFANLCFPPSHDLLDDSAFDPGSPQYVRPEDMMLDIQSSLFGFPRKQRGLRSLDHPSDFEKHWKDEGAPAARVNRSGGVTKEDLTGATMTLLRCSKRKAEHHPTVLPLVPAVSAYKSISAKLPVYFNDQLRPLISAADPAGFPAAIAKLRAALRGDHQPEDTLLKIAHALIPLPPALARVEPPDIPAHQGPLVMDFSGPIPVSLPICRSYIETLATLVELELKVPRVLWVRWLTAANRLYLPLFFLQRCSVASGAARAARSVLSGESAPDIPVLTAELLPRKAVLRGSPEMLNQLQPAVQEYVRARIELAAMLHLACIAENVTEPIEVIRNPTNKAKLGAHFEKYYMHNGAAPKSPKPLAMPGDPGPDRIPLEQWLSSLEANRGKMDAIAVLIGADSAVDLVDRVFGELRSDYMPLTNGFGKNAREFVAFTLGAPTKAERDPTMPDEFNLLVRNERSSAPRQVAVRPGSQLLELLVQLVTQEAQATHLTNAKLGDICDLFQKIGVDFRSEPADFDFLKEELLRQGLLESSADAAEAAGLKAAYAFRK
jgi:hypothetical protein